jgi:hypothetical protein
MDVNRTFEELIYRELEGEIFKGCELNEGFGFGWINYNIDTVIEEALVRTVNDGERGW